MKEGYVQKGAENAVDMEKINRYTRREYRPEEVYIFSLVLCDNDIDRDFERFDLPALEKLKELFPGRTCILDHERKSANQTARIFDAALEREKDRLTLDGEPYVRLTAMAYLPRTEGNRETIELIEGGILKEVSVSCAVKRSVCSICGKESCQHQRGKSYGGKVCCRILQEPTDAFECSFVAVPAQREAGVRKSWQEGGDLEQRLEKSAEEGMSLTAPEARRLGETLNNLREKARWGEKYRARLEADLLKYSAILQPEAPRDVMKSAFGGLPLDQLTELCRAYEAMAARSLPLKPQLARETGTVKEEGNAAFRI